MMVDINETLLRDIYRLAEILAIVALVMIGVAALMIGYAYPELEGTSYVIGIVAGIVVWEEMKRMLSGQHERNSEEGSYESPFD
jgi:hypothetical protein